jgi:hypothetical protein
MTSVFVEGVYAPWMAHPSLQGGIHRGGAQLASRNKYRRQPNPFELKYQPMKPDYHSWRSFMDKLERATFSAYVGIDWTDTKHDVCIQISLRCMGD